MTLIIAAVSHPIEFGVATLMAGAMVFVWLRAAMTPEGRPNGWVRAITSPNAKYLFGFLFVVWAVVFGLTIGQFPNVVSSPYGGLALIALFSGFFIMMGFLWAVIGG
ncbi:MAG TPA: hypothetical protein VF763_12705 [Candidatus Limnocylindrales bacterium]